MNLQSILYFMFLTLVWLGGMLCTSAKRRQLALLAASYLFYATWSPAFTLLLMASSGFNYAWGRILRRDASVSKLWTGILVNLAPLFFFKYAESVLLVLGLKSPDSLPFILMPIGLSFYTFQAMGYLLDIYRGYEDQPTLLEFSLFLAFWPTILSGPICRVPEMIPQFREAASPTKDDVSEGCRRIIIGLFMKMVLADILEQGIITGEGVRYGFDRMVGGWGGLDVLFLAAGFGFQLFFDFAGYSHIAIGSARLFGIRLRENFNDPFISSTPSEFWTRWHMSLSSWIRDYVFFPLVMLSRHQQWRYLAILISMVIFGIWHGVGATFIVWGFYQGLLLVIHRYGEQFLRSRRSGIMAGRPGAFISWGLTCLFISLGWVVFRAHNLTQASTMISALFSPASYWSMAMRPNFYIMISLVAFGYFFSILLKSLIQSWQSSLLERLVWITSPVYYSVIVMGIIIWSKQGANFIYFQF